MTEPRQSLLRGDGRDPAPAKAAGLLVLAVTVLRALGSLADAAGPVAPARPPVSRYAGRRSWTAGCLPPRRPARRLHAAALALAGCVLADSAIEHDRGSFENPGMLAPLIVAALAMLAGVQGATDPRPRRFRRRIYRTASGTGLAGTGFHLFNLLRRPGGLSWQSLFYGAPVGAPAALSLAGLVGEAAEAIASPSPAEAPRLAGLPAGRALAGLAGIGIAGTSAEAALLHFRGAFHNPLMVLPVSLPPVSAVLLAVAALSRPLPGTRAALAATALLGPIGTALHAYGVSRAMGGWRNWRQTMIDGPPLPAPPAFSALALVGWVALDLLEARRGRR